LAGELLYDQLPSGRSVVPIPVSQARSLTSITYVDGGPPPTVTVDDGTFELLAAITNAASAAATLCNFSSGSTTFTTLSVSVPTQPATVPGHITDNRDSALCTKCENGCDLNDVACASGATGGCAGLGALT
jgi:hypothetical protein